MNHLATSEQSFGHRWPDFEIKNQQASPAEATCYFACNSVRSSLPNCPVQCRKAKQGSPRHHRLWPDAEEGVGFSKVPLTNRNPWYEPLEREEGFWLFCSSVIMYISPASLLHWAGVLSREIETTTAKLCRPLEVAAPPQQKY